ncbi:hypothetical protein ACIF8W_13960 [Streptomyces sp. NPDC085639]|uniref:hypothetical protein n=1 Tax=Streptomyces sp. NPDC085639 TaxID=3365734 RepID=UPI0037CE8787
MLDMYAVTGQREYRDGARDIAETILWFRFENEDGIGLFLSRLVSPGEDAFVDHRGPVRQRPSARPASGTVSAAWYNLQHIGRDRRGTAGTP